MKRALASLGARTVSAVALFSFSACTATIHRINAPNLEAEIVSSDAEGLEVASDQGTTYRVPRESVTAIDHPGDVAALLGAAAVVVGGLVAVTAGDAGSDDGRRRAFVPGLVLSSVGFAFLLGGIVPYSQSRRAAHGFAETPTAARALPFDTRWGAPLPAAVAQVKRLPAPAPPEPRLSEALLPLPASEEPEPAVAPTERPAAAPAERPAVSPAARPPEPPRPVFKPAPPALPRQ